ncbi:hypothetical protein [Streptomyces sp. TRM64462]|uniref:hypothetical protein n=1 Tax=Streptomyces sp. TRM64462 TaxID=2741726 RepID=UPI0028149704|nr:hypothetical protein [Streptomyces sp. TRM64462]
MPASQATASGPAPRSAAATTPPPPTDSSAAEVVRWAAFSCALVPFVLLVYGTSFGAAAGTALGLAAVTVTCRALLRRSERAAPALLPEPPPQVAGAGAESGGGAPVPHRGRHSRTGSGAHRGGRHGAVGAPGD